MQGGEIVILPTPLSQFILLRNSKASIQPWHCMDTLPNTTCGFSLLSVILEYCLALGSLHLL